ncbi:MAG TPA: hypothetical protein VNO74_02620 [Methylomirabilota bacterium]|nr:hypothetical protein [Methylomirabilota bacterium]
MSTSLGIDRITMRQLATAMALIVAIASLPSIGVIVIADRNGPSLTLDVCHPLQSLDTSSTVVLIARPAPPEINATIISPETIAEFVPLAKDNPAETPDPPPPKQIS